MTDPQPVAARVADAGPDAVVRAVAQQLSLAADHYNARLKTQAAAGHLDSGSIYLRLQEEQRLRGMANQLWFESADLRLASAGGDLAALHDAVGIAAERIAAMQRDAAVLDVVADLLALAAALLSRKPQTVVVALEALRHDVTLG